MAMQTPPSCESYILPDLLHISQLFKASTNPHWAKVAPESSAWVSSYNIFTDRKHMEFIMGSNELLASLTYPQASYNTFRTCCDFLNLLFVIDEISDDQSGEGARLTGKVFLNAMRDSECTDGSDSIMAKMARDFRARLLQSIGAHSFRRFLKHLEDYLESVAKEAEYRERGYLLDMEQFKHLRRENSAVRCVFGMIEHTLGIDLPDVVFEDATFMKIYWAALDMVWCANDVYSYNMELAKGDNHTANNILSVFMAANGVSLQDASDYVGRHCARLMEEYLSARAELASKSFGSQKLDSDVLNYVNAMENWPIGNIEWSFKTARYFGSQNNEVKQTLVVKLKPQEVPA